MTSVLPITDSVDADSYSESLKSKFEDSLKMLVTGQIPQTLVRQRPGRGGGQFSYVPVWWVIDQLNNLFNFNWDWRIVREDVGSGQVWVIGELTIRTEVGTITKSAYGGTDIKKTGGNTIDIGDDLKSASSDALKKAASMVGIAASLYKGGGENGVAVERDLIDSSLMKTITLRYKKLGWTEDQFKDWVRGESNSDLNPDHLDLEEVPRKNHSPFMVRLTQLANQS